MIKRVKVAVVGVGNNISALVQGIALHRATGSLVGIHHPVLDGLGVGDIDFMAAFATSPEKVGKDLTEAIFLPPNNFPRLTSDLPPSGVAVRRGLTDANEVERMAGELAGAEVVRRPVDGRRPRAPMPGPRCRLARRSSTPPPTRWPAIGSCLISLQWRGCRW